MEDTALVLREVATAVSNRGFAMMRVNSLG
jgi:hypothetical protein